MDHLLYFFVAFSIYPLYAFNLLFKHFLINYRITICAIMGAFILFLCYNIKCLIINHWNNCCIFISGSRYSKLDWDWDFPWSFFATNSSNSYWSNETEFLTFWSFTCTSVKIKVYLETAIPISIFMSTSKDEGIKQFLFSSKWYFMLIFISIKITHAFLKQDLYP